MEHLMDEIDKKIMALLQYNARMSISQISKEVSMSQPSVKERMIKLEEKTSYLGITQFLIYGK